MPFEDGTDRSSQNVAKELPLYAANIPEERRLQLPRGGNLKSRVDSFVVKVERETEYEVSFCIMRELIGAFFWIGNLKIKVYITIILPVVLYGCGTWSLILRKERRLRMFENRVFRRIFGPTRDKVIGVWRKLHNV